MAAAMVGGVSYAASKRGARAAQREADEDAMAQQYAAPQPEAANPDDSIQTLQKLAQLHEQGILTDVEFEMQKQKILQGM